MEGFPMDKGLPKKWLSQVSIALITMLGLLLSPLRAQAAAILDFNIGFPTLGSISYAGGGTGSIWFAVAMKRTCCRSNETSR